MTDASVSGKAKSKKHASLVLALVIAYVAFQLLFPLRHFLYKRDVQWTHEGADFSWRMMGDHHETNGGITVEDPTTHEVYLHSPETLLTRKQLVMVNNPRMLIQYIGFLKGFLKQHNGLKDPIVRVDIQVSVNGKPFQNMYDPTVNLADVAYSPFADLNWIVPLRKN